MLDPSLRYIAILELIPREPDGITVAQLIAELDKSNPPSIPRNDKELKAEIRKTQRDLNKLAQQYPLFFDKNGAQYLWYWDALVPPTMFPSLDINTALILSLAKSYLDPIIPNNAASALARLFNQAEAKFDRQYKNSADKGAFNWRDKVAMAATGIARVQPKVDHKIERTIYEALLNERAVNIKYQAWNSSQVKEYVVSPNGLVVRNQLIYLVAVNHTYEKTFNLLMHRVKAAEIVSDQFHKIEGFKAQDYVNNGGLGFSTDASNTKIWLHIKFDTQPLTSLQESPLSKDQKIHEDYDNHFSLTATVENTMELRQWLRSYAHHIEVISPQELRDEFIKSTEIMMNKYSKF